MHSLISLNWSPSLQKAISSYASRTSERECWSTTVALNSKKVEELTRKFALLFVVTRRWNLHYDLNAKRAYLQLHAGLHRLCILAHLNLEIWLGGFNISLDFFPLLLVCHQYYKLLQFRFLTIFSTREVLLIELNIPSNKNSSITCTDAARIRPSTASDFWDPASFFIGRKFTQRRNNRLLRLVTKCKQPFARSPFLQLLRICAELFSASCWKDLCKAYRGHRLRKSPVSTVLTSHQLEDLLELAPSLGRWPRWCRD